MGTMSYLTEKDGKQSAMRVGFFISLGVASTVAIMGVYLNRDLVGLAALAGMFLGAGFGGKAIQKGKE